MKRGVFGVDVLNKLRRLRNKLDQLNQSDREFVSEMFNLQEQAERLTRHQILRIVDLVVPGESNVQTQNIWTNGMVTAVFCTPDDVIWRYMPLEQLFFVLSQKVLHFSPLALMSDATEGQLPPEAFEETKQQLTPRFADGQAGLDADTVTRVMISQRRTDASINCWYTNESDALAMWQQYAPKNGVAIRSTVGRLSSSLAESRTPVTISPVRYFGLAEEGVYNDEAFCGSLFNKHDPYTHEKELRVLVYQVNSGRGVDVQVNIKGLIESLVLSPELQEWAVPFMTQAIRHFGFDGAIEKSKIVVP